MQTFKKFLLENNTYSHDEIIQAIKRDCQPYLSHTSADAPMYRGAHMPEAYAFSPPITNRPALHSAPSSTNFFNMMIYAGFGIENIRSKTLFTTGSHHQARSYGPLYFAFPKGDFSILYSHKISDSLTSNSTLFNHFGLSLSKKLKTDESIGDYLVYKLFGAVHKDDLLYIFSDSKNGEKELHKILSESDPIKYEKIFKNVKLFDVITAALKSTAQEYYNIATPKDVLAAIKDHSELFIYESEGLYMMSVPDVMMHYKLTNSPSLYKQAYGMIISELGL